MKKLTILFVVLTLALSLSFSSAYYNDNVVRPAYTERFSSYSSVKYSDNNGYDKTTYRQVINRKNVNGYESYSYSQSYSSSSKNTYYSPRYTQTISSGEKYYYLEDMDGYAPSHFRYRPVYSQKEYYYKPMMNPSGYYDWRY